MLHNTDSLFALLFSKLFSRKVATKNSRSWKRDLNWPHHAVNSVVEQSQERLPQLNIKIDSVSTYEWPEVDSEDRFAKISDICSDFPHFSLTLRATADRNPNLTKKLRKLTH